MPVFGAMAAIALSRAFHAGEFSFAPVLPRMSGMPHFSEKSSQSFQERRLDIARMAAVTPTPSPTVTSHSPARIGSPV